MHLSRFTPFPPNMLVCAHNVFDNSTPVDQSVMCFRKVTNLRCYSKMKFLSNDYTNPNTNPKTITALTLTLTDTQDALESYYASIFCDFIRNYFLDSESKYRTP